MKVRVRLFGAEEQELGRSTIEVEVGDRARARDVVRAIGVQWPKLKRARLAVNHAFATGDEVVGVKDELALIGMVSGG